MKDLQVSQFLNKLRDQANDEERDHHKYMALSSEARQLGFPSTAGILRNIARDELHHHKVLKQRIEMIERIGRV